VRFWLGLAIGLAVGSGAMYLVLEAPWRGAPAATATATPDAAPGTTVATSGKKGKRGGKARRTPGGSQGDDDTGREPGDFEETAPPIVLTAADRELIWQGDAVKPPARTVDMAEDGEARTLDDGEISSVVNAQGGAVIDCMLQAAGGSGLVATVTLKLIVEGNGRVGKLRVQAPRYLFDQGLHGCVKRAAARFTFPATGAPTLVVMPFELSAR
jgi:hypothetical protein